MERRTVVTESLARRAALPAFLAACALLGALGLLSMLKPGARPLGASAEGLVDGKASAAFQDAFAEALPLEDFAVAALARLRYDAFGEAYPGALVGDGGWLFSSEEFDAEFFADGFRGSSLPGSSFADKVAFARDALAARGMALIVVPVPAKARVEAGRLGRYALPPALEPRYGLVLDALAALGVPAVDMEAVFSPLDSEPFLRTDTHWTPASARIAAFAAADLALGLPAAAGLGGAAYVSGVVGTEERDGDLMAFLPARGACARALPEPDSVDEWETVAASEGGAGGLFGAQVVPVAVVGTSYSAESQWNFDGFLREAFSCDVLKLASEGSGPYEPMAAALAGSTLDDVACSLVIWEIPERYVPLSSLR